MSDETGRRDLPGNRSRFSLRMSLPSSAPLNPLESGFNFSCRLIPEDKSRFWPTARSGHRISADEANLYSFGGYNPPHDNVSHGLFGEVWRFNLATRRWTILSYSGPLEAASHTMVLMNGCLIVFAGTGHPWGTRLSNAIHVFHLPSLKWQQLLCHGDSPSPRYGHTMNVCADGVYVIGGTTGVAYSMSVHRLELKTLVWHDVTPNGATSPCKRYRHEAVTFKKWIFVLGGVLQQTVFDFVRIPAFNTEIHAWCQLNSKGSFRGNCYPPPRKFFSVTQFGDFAYVCGGYKGKHALDDIWRLCLATLRWERLPASLPKPVYFHAATVTPAGCMFVFGGVLDAFPNTRTNCVLKMWLTVPCLQEMTWDVLTEKFSKFFARNTDALCGGKIEGIKLPPKFLRRLK